MIIECIGLPGSGKTTATKRISKDLSVYIPPKYPGRLFAVLFLLRHPLYSLFWHAAILFEAVRTGTISLTRFKVASFLYTAARYMNAKSVEARGEIALLDEGMLQRALTLYEHKVDSATMRFWVRRTPLSSHMLCFTGRPFEENKISPIRARLGEEYVKTRAEILSHNQQELVRALALNGRSAHLCSAHSKESNSCDTVVRLLISQYASAS